MSDETNLGTWETRATEESWNWGSRWSTEAPDGLGDGHHLVEPAGGRRLSEQTTHGRASKRSTRADTAPDRSRPAMGWDPM